MLVYLLDDVGEYIGEMECQESPLEPGVVLTPNANYTIKSPPPAGERQALVFKNDTWEYIPDWRGVKLWHKQTGISRIETELNLVPGSEWTEKDPAGIEFPCFDESLGNWITDETKKKAYLAAAIRSQRDPLIRAAQDRIDRYRNELDDGEETTETPETIALVRAYIKALRQITDQVGFPTTVTWPEIVHA